jgi:mannose-6-phosphate isomerase
MAVSLLVFEPLPMERVWGGRRLEAVLGKALPPGSPVGESWEVVDREDAQSVVHGGDLAGCTLHELWARHRAAVFGAAYENHPAPRFPILVKLLDTREKLSVQVHPPAHLAGALGGESKTEMWYFLDCLPGASIYAGLKRGVTRENFERAMEDGRVEEAVHRIPVQAGKSIFIPSGRVHALGDGCLLLEVQQNSDTTYRVFDWNRTGLDGKPRALHTAESMTCIDFEDFEPSLEEPQSEMLSACAHFTVEKWTLEAPRAALESGRFAIFGVVEGAVAAADAVFERGGIFLLPATVSQDAMLRPVGGAAAVVRVTLPPAPADSFDSSIQKSLDLPAAK